MAAVGQAVEVLEDDAVTAADDGALGDVDDAEPAVLGRPTRGSSKNDAQRSQNTRCDRCSRSPERGATRGGLVVIQPRRRDVGHLVSRLPGAQAVVDVLIAHAVGLVEEPDRVEDVAPDVHARAGGGERRSGDVGRSPVGRLAAVAVVKPLRRARVADRAGVLDPVVRVQQLGAGDPGRPIAAHRVLQARQPVAQRRHVGVEQDDVVRRGPRLAGRG